MKRKCILILTSSFIFTASAFGETMPIDLNPEKFMHVKFDKIPETQYALQKDILDISVDSSSSALVMQFDAPKKISQVSFQWQSSDDRTKLDPKVEKQKSGDDFPLRVGMIMSGKAPWIPFIAPAWIKALRDFLKHPTNRLVYLVAGSNQPEGSEWESPYSSSISNIAIPTSLADADGFKTSTYKPDSPIEMVGLWIMSDGDNLKRKFKTQLKNLNLEISDH